MMFEEGTNVSYLSMNGVIDFVCKNYVVISLKSEESRRSARLLVYRHNYSEIRECGD